MRHDGGLLGSWFTASGPRMANTTRVPSGEVSTSFTSQRAPAVRRAVMLVSVALGEARRRDRTPCPSAQVLAAALRVHVRLPEVRGLSAAGECNVIEVVLSTNRHNYRPERRSHHGPPLRLAVFIAPRCAAPIALLGKRANAGTP